MGNIEIMYKNVPQPNESNFVQKRNRIILKLLEITEARVGEIALLTVQYIENVFTQDKPTLKMRILKKRGQLVDYRYVPVNKVDFNKIGTYIKIYRSKIIKNTIGKSNDEGFLLINENKYIEINIGSTIIFNISLFSSNVPFNNIKIKLLNIISIIGISK